MRKYLLIIYIFLLTFTLGAIGNTSSVSITLTTSVPGYLLHGFLDTPGTTTFIQSPTVNNAFNPAGAILNYGIKTNSGLPLIVKATITPFKEQDVLDPAMVPVTQVEVGSSSGTAMHYIDEDGKYKLLELTPQSGTIFYAYTLTVFVDQSKVMNSPAGNYVSTVEIDIATVN